MWIYRTSSQIIHSYIGPFLWAYFQRIGHIDKHLDFYQVQWALLDHPCRSVKSSALIWMKRKQPKWSVTVSLTRPWRRIEPFSSGGGGVLLSYSRLGWEDYILFNILSCLWDIHIVIHVAFVLSAGYLLFLFMELTLGLLEPLCFQSTYSVSSKHDCHRVAMNSRDVFIVLRLDKVMTGNPDNALEPYVKEVGEWLKSGHAQLSRN